VSRGGTPSLTYNFQSGVRYFIGVKADSPRRADWELVVWKEEEMREGALDFE